MHQHIIFIYDSELRQASSGILSSAEFQFGQDAETLLVQPTATIYKLSGVFDNELKGGEYSIAILNFMFGKELKSVTLLYNVDLCASSENELVFRHQVNSRFVEINGRENKYMADKIADVLYQKRMPSQTGLTAIIAGSKLRDKFYIDAF